MLRNEGWNVNHKRMKRIWQQAGLNDGSCIRIRPER